MGLWRSEVAGGGVWDSFHPGLSGWWASELGSRAVQGRVERGSRGWGGAGTVKALSESSSLQVMRKDLGSVSAPGPGRQPSVSSGHPLPRGEGGQVEAQWMVGCFISSEG